MCVAYIFTKLWTGKFFGFLARSSYIYTPRPDTRDIAEPFNIQRDAFRLGFIDILLIERDSTVRILPT